MATQLSLGYQFFHAFCQVGTVGMTYGIKTPYPVGNQMNTPIGNQMNTSLFS